LGLFVGSGCGQGLQIAADDLGSEVLQYRQLGQAGNVLQVKTVFEALESLLDALAAVVQVAGSQRHG
jgi:hypothetical protein